MKKTALCLAGLLVGNLVASCQTGEPNQKTVRAEGNTNATDSHKAPVVVQAKREEEPVTEQTGREEEPVTEQTRREWALGCAAVLTERNHENHTLLGGCIPCEPTKADMRRRLSGSWDINSREELFETLDSLDQHGHRANFEKVGLLVSFLDEAQFQALLRKTDDPEMLNKLRVARQYYKQLGPKGLYGWDYSRAICLCRWAYVVGYINEDEAWQRIMPMALLLQEKFDSWEDLGQNYLIGRQFWSYEETQENGWECEDAVQRLLDMQCSPWNRYPWDTKLKDGGKKDSTPKEQPREERKNPKRGKDVIAALW